MPSAFKTLILALLITFSFLTVSKFSVASDLSNLSDDEVCDGYFAKDKEGDDYFLGGCSVSTLNQYSDDI